MAQRTELSDGGNGIAVVGLIVGVIVAFTTGVWWGLLVYLVATGIARHADWFVGVVKGSSTSGRMASADHGGAAPGGDDDVPAGSVQIPTRTLHFSYRDGQGDESTREVDVSHVSPRSFTGWCHLRGEVRTFRWDRVHGELMDMHTGELYLPQQAFSSLSE